MKTDDYKQELRLSASLHARNAKKIFLRSKHISKSPEKFWDFFQSCRGRSQDRECANLRRKKTASSREGPLGSDDDITLVSMF
jgi:hypothetical protein